MNLLNQETCDKALVAVFEDKKTSVAVVIALRKAGFSPDRIQLVTHHLPNRSPEIESPNVQETTDSSIIAFAEKWGLVGLEVGAAVGIVAAAITTFPVLAFGMIVVGGLTGAVMGGVAGVDNSIRNNAVDLPTLDEYERLLQSGSNLVVLLGSHDDTIRACEIISKLPNARTQSLHGHEYHEHPAAAIPSNNA